MQPASVICPQCGRQLHLTARYCGACGAALTSPSSAVSFTRAESLGARGRYRIERALGRGGFGETYLAADTQLGRACVVKRLVLPPGHPPATQQRLRQNFQREARLLATLNVPGHPNIPEIYEYLAEHDCLVMKYIEGRNLDQVLERRTDPLPQAEALRYVRDVCAALVYMHSRTPEPVLHRDIKPANILLDTTDRIWLIDFGLAKALPLDLLPSLAADTQAAGTLGYTPPEQWRGAAEPRSDVFALAATLHVLLTMHQPERGTLLALMQGRATLPPARSLNPALSPEVEQLIQQGMAIAVAERPTAQEFLAALDAILNRSTLPPPALTRPPVVTDFVNRRDELEYFTQLLANEHLALIAGPAGVGKTTLAAVLASKHPDSNRVFWHSFHPGESAETIIWKLAGFFAYHGQDDLWRLLQAARQGGGQLPPADLLFDYLVAGLSGRDYMLVFDDVQYVDDDPQMLRFITRVRDEVSSNRGILVITSRHAPAFATTAYRPLGGLRRADMRELLLRRDLQLPEPMLDELYARTEGNAQLLQLAIDSLRQSGDPARLIANLATTDNVTRYLLREVDAELSDEQRDVMSAVAVLLGYPGSRDAIEAILDRSRLQRVLQDLSDRHLLTVGADEGARSYGLHALVQAFYYEQLSKRERTVLHRRAGAFYEAEEIDLLKAARHFLIAGEAARAAHLLTADVWAFINQGQARALRHLLEQCTAAQLEPGLWIAVVLARGEIYTLLRESVPARAAYSEALERLAALPDTPVARARKAHACRGMGALLEAEAPQEALTWLRRGLAELGLRAEVPAAQPSATQDERLEEALLRLRIGAALIAMGDYAEARAELERSLALLPAGPSQWRADALIKLGVILTSQGELAQGKQHYLQALDDYQQAHNLWGMIGTRHNLGIEMDVSGQWNAAAEEYRSALAMAERLGSRVHQTDLELCLGNLYVKTGDMDAAFRHLTQARDLARAHRLQEELVCVQSSLADLLIRLEDWSAAEEALAEAEPLALALEIKHQLPEICRSWAQLQLAQGATQAAYARAAHAVALAEALTEPREEGMSLRVLGQALLAAGQAESALEVFAGSLARLDQLDPYEAARTRMHWGSALRAAGDAAQGSALLQAARATFAQLGAQYEVVVGGETPPLLDGEIDD